MKVIELQMRKLSTGTAGPCTQRDLQTVIEDMLVMIYIVAYMHVCDNMIYRIMVLVKGVY